MRRVSLATALLIGAVVFATAAVGGVAGVASADGTAHAGDAVVGTDSAVAVTGGADAVTGASDTPTLTGRVTDEDGTPVADAYVLAERTSGSMIDEATADGDVRDGLRKLAESDPDGVVVARTDEDGRYELSVPDAGSYTVVAIADERVSRLRPIGADDGGPDLTVSTHQVLEVTTSGTTAAPGETVTVFFSVTNHDDDRVMSLSIDHGELPAGWRITDYEATTGYDPTENRFSWTSIDPGAGATVELTIRIPSGVEPGQYRIDLAGESRTHLVETTEPIRVEVEDPDATPTGIDTPGPTATATTVGGGEGGDDGGSTAPGVLVTILVVSLLVGGLLAAREAL